MVKSKYLFDTNVYGKIIKDRKENEFQEFVKKNRDMAVYGSRVIRNELREIPKEYTIHERNVRMLALNLYDALIDMHKNYELTEVIEYLANQYFRKLKANFLTNYPEQKLKNDLLIVATASIHQLDIVVSEDMKTLANPQFIEMYGEVNRKNQLKSPAFIRLDKLLKL